MARGARDFKAEYAKRIARNLEKGKTRQQARGHREREHIHRAEREREEFGLTRANIASIERWHNAYVNNEKRDLEELIDETRENGYAWFVNYRDVWNESRRKYLREQRTGTYIPGGPSYLELLASLEVVPDIQWAYYH